MKKDPEHLKQPVLKYARTDFATLRRDLNVQEALDNIRQQGLGERIVYFYVVDENRSLVGVLPTRRLLTSALVEKIGNIMIKNVVTISRQATLLEACEFFILYRFLSFPVVDEHKRILGVIDVTFFKEEVFEISEHEKMDELFESIGFHLSQVRDASALRAFRFRFPWLLVTIGSGTICALLAGAFELTLARVILLAFFLTLVLALSESVSIQSMTLTIQTLRFKQPTFKWYLKAIARESMASLFIGSGCGLVTFGVVWLWQSAFLPALAIGCSVLLTLIAACAFGLTVPAILHALKLDPKVAAGPITLALTDITTLSIYFSLGALVL
ncbi:MAG: magnesium transporter [Desulfobacteraceae bacterium]|nr:MAG: magnesium transporter [Desulfobacteraceae bacterium]